MRRSLLAKRIAPEVAPPSVVEMPTGLLLWTDRDSYVHVLPFQHVVLTDGRHLYTDSKGKPRWGDVRPLVVEAIGL